MKYLIKYKTHENKITTSGNYGNYYIIHIDGSFEKFEIASLKFKGEIFIEDYELDAKKFNI
jgi:hypothetical protein